MVDTLVRSPDGVVGLNANSFSIEAACALISPVAPERVLIVGTGASARSALLGVAACWPGTDIAVVGRDPRKADDLVDDLEIGRVTPARGYKPDLIVHSTTVGERDDSDRLELPIELFEARAFLDLNVRHSELQRTADAWGATTLGGSYVQAVNDLMRATILARVPSDEEYDSEAQRRFAGLLALAGN